MDLTNGEWLIIMALLWLKRVICKMRWRAPKRRVSMSSKKRRALLAAQKARRERIAIVALTLTLSLSLCMAAGVFAWRGYQRRNDPARPLSLEELERSGRLIMAYDGDNMGEMLGSDGLIPWDDLAAEADQWDEEEEAEAQAASKPDITDDPSKEFHYTVTVVADGEEQEVKVTRHETVEEILQKAKVTLGPEDEMSHFPARTTSPGDRIVVERWTRDVHITEKEVPFEVVEIPTSLLREGKRSVANAGTNGIAEQTFHRLLRDGVVVEQELIEEELISQPIAQRVLVGDSSAPISGYDFAWELDETGAPTEYAALLENQRATGYSARPGAGTASGLVKAAVGHVAVNPNVIPYGSKLYIQSRDGQFVYGYAIAADTGIGLMQGVIDVDLFYATYEESCMNGLRTVDIYILEYPA